MATLNEAEKGFFALLSDDSIQPTKVAVDLDSDIAEALGVSGVSPKILDELEDQAASVPEVSSEDTPDQTEIGQFDRRDEEPPQEVEGEAEPELPTRATHGKLFSDKQAHPLQLLDVLTSKYGTDWVDWESDTLWWSLRQNFGSVGEVVRNKIMALRLAVTTDVPWLDFDTFEDCGLSWNDIVPTIGYFQPMTPMQAAFAVQVLRGIRPDDQFGHEVKAYIAAILDDHGWVWAPEEWFDGAQEILEKEKDFLVGLKNDVMTTWEQVKDEDPTQIDWKEDPRDIHIMKLFVVQSYLAEREAFRDELPGGVTSASTVSPAVP